MWARDRRSSFLKDVERRSTGSYGTEKATAVREPAVRTWKFTRYRDEQGTALVEYSLLLGLIALLAIPFLAAIGTDTLDLYDAIKDAIQSALG
jgi:Flp pilus assembly pilin Flp